MVFAPLTNSIHCPSKVFLWGEYGVLAGGEALVAAIEPSFELRPSSEVLHFHPDSPAEKYIKSQYPQQGQFVDPYKGEGGFGGSTAEFALTLYHYGEREVWRAYRRYKELVPEASGADLIAQWLGGVQRIDLKLQTTCEVSTEWKHAPIYLFQASHQKNRKTQTHTHLPQVKQSDLEVIKQIQSLAFKEKSPDWPTLWNQYSQVLMELGLEHPQSTQDRIKFLQVPGVLGVKGCGARGSDVIMVWVNSEWDGERTELLKVAHSLNLRFLSKGLKLSRGIS